MSLSMLEIFNTLIEEKERDLDQIKKKRDYWLKHIEPAVINSNTEED